MKNSRKILLKKAKEAMKFAKPIYSEFRVGAALKTKDGKIFTGCNIENISMGLTICAERVALFKAVSEGYVSFDSIAITSSSYSTVFPCGPCRQFLAEFNSDLDVYVEHDEKTYKMSDLIPHAFTKEQMK